MSLSYDPLWNLLDELNMTKMEFAKAIGISNATLAKIGKNEPITLTTIDRICNELECRIEDVVQHIPDIYLNQQKSSLPIEVGSIVTVCFSPADASPINLYVILDIRNETIGNLETFQYTLAPIIDSPDSFLSLYFKDVAINGKLSHGWINLYEFTTFSSEYFVKIVGKMPKDILQKIIQFVTFAKEFDNY